MRMSGPAIHRSGLKDTLRYTQTAAVGAQQESKPEGEESSSDEPRTPKEAKQTKSATELDEELRQKMEDMAGDGGAAGVEFEDGQPVAMKRSVRNNMFRYI